jgi:DNA-binding XRE family transcriptional regulator
MESDQHPLRSYRRDRGWTLEQASAALGMSKSRLSEIENGATCTRRAARRIDELTGGKVPEHVLMGVRIPTAHPDTS